MISIRNALVTAGALAGMVFASGAALAGNGYSITNLNLRAGPGLDFRVVTTIPRETPVEIYGCLEAFDWCDVGWTNYRGWVSADYLSWYNGGRYYGVQDHGRRSGLTVVAFDFGYWDLYYRDYPWYRDRGYGPPRYREPYYGDTRGRGPLPFGGWIGFQIGASRD